MRRETEDGRREAEGGARSDPPALELRGIEVRHGDRMTLNVPELTVAAGEVLALLGPNGAGKSTLLQVAALLHRPTRGEVRIGGEPATRRRVLALRRQIAMVFQDPLLLDIDVLANAASGLRFRGVGRRDAERVAAVWLDRFGVAHLARRGVRGLSGGEAQRVALARAFAVDPALLLLDEPFAALDAPTRAALAPDLAARLRETRTAAVVVTHDQAEAVALGDRLGVVLHGRIAHVGPPATVMERPANRDVAAFLGVDNLLPVRVVSSEPNRIVVALGAGGPFLTVAPSPHPPGVGQSVTLAIRAARVAVRARAARQPSGANTLSGTVTTVAWAPLGHRIAAHLGGIPATIHGLSEHSLPPGVAVTVTIPPDAGHLILDDSAT